MSVLNWVHKTAVEQRAALDRGDISSVELLEATIEHTESLVPYLNPVAVRLYDRARRAALAADKKLARGKGGSLCGIPVTIKDSQWIAGTPCTNGSLTLNEFIPAETSLSVQRLEAAGAIIFAKTTCPELSLSGITESSVYGRTSNPWDLGRTPGGSSGGAGAAVAAGMGSLSLGSDGGGSIRIPAAFCGITGFKPSHGVVPRQPGFSTWESLVAYGPMARCVADAKLMFSVLSEIDTDTGETDKNAGVHEGRQNRKPLSRKNQGKSSFIFSEDLGFAPVDWDIRHAFRDVVARFENAGNTVKHDNPGLKTSIVTWVTTATYDMWAHRGQSGKRQVELQNDMGEYAREFIKLGGSFSKTDYADAQAQKVEIHDAYIEMFKRNRTSILVTPTLGCEAFRHGTVHPAEIESRKITYPWLDWAGFLYDANLAGFPACSIPMGLGGEGMPLSLQIMGPPGHDTEVLRAALVMESILDWQHPEFSPESYSGGQYLTPMAGPSPAIGEHGLLAARQDSI